MLTRNFLLLEKEYNEICNYPLVLYGTCYHNTYFGCYCNCTFFYLVYKLFLQSLLSKRSLTQTLEKYNIDKTPSQIIKEYYENKGESLSHQEIQKLEKKLYKKWARTISSNVWCN